MKMRYWSFTLLIVLVIGLGYGDTHSSVKSMPLTSVESVIDHLDDSSHREIHSVELTKKGKNDVYELTGKENQKGYRWLVNSHSGEMIEKEETVVSQEEPLQLNKNVLIQNLSIMAEVSAGKGVATAWQLANLDGKDVWKITVSDGKQQHIVTIDNNTLAIEAVNQL